MLLRSVIELCYGGVSNEPALLKQQEGEIWKLGYDYVTDSRVDSMLKDFSKLVKQEWARTVGVPFDVKIMGRNDETGEDEWAVGAHSAIICAHSSYARALLTHGWTFNRSPEGDCKLLILDASHFSRDLIEELVQACYTNTLPCLDYSRWFSPQRPTLDYFFQLYDAASFLGMESLSMLVADSLLLRMGTRCFPEILDFAEKVHSTYIVKQWKKYVCREAGFFDETTISRLSPVQIEAMLMSDSLEMPEEEILSMLLVWSNSSDAGTKEYVKSLIRHVRLPLVPLGSIAMKQAVERCLVSRDELELCHHFQTDEYFRASVIGSKKFFQLRCNEYNRDHLLERKKQLGRERRQAIAD
jgi:hypothetical protein